MQFILEDAKELWLAYKTIVSLAPRTKVAPGVALEFIDGNNIAVHTRNNDTYAEVILPVDIINENMSKIILGSMSPFEFLVGKTTYVIDGQRLAAVDENDTEAEASLTGHDPFIFTRMLSDKVEFKSVPDITGVKFAMGGKNSTKEYVVIGESIVTATDRFMVAIQKLDEPITSGEVYITPILPDLSEIGFSEKRIWFADGDMRCSTTSVDIPMNLSFEKEMLAAAARKDNYVVVNSGELKRAMKVMKSVGPWMATDKDVYRAMMFIDDTAMFHSANTQIGLTKHEITSLERKGKIEASINPAQILGSLGFIDADIVMLAYSKFGDGNIIILSDIDQTKVVGIAPIENSWYYKKGKNDDQETS